MMPTIRISDTNWQRMKNNARPLEDSADDVIGRALDALEKGKSLKVALSKILKAKSPPANGEKLPQRGFRIPLLEVLIQLGNEAPAKEVRALMEKKMAPRLSPADYENVTTGDPRWWNAICWERSDMVKEGLMRDDSERGIWAISEAGKELVAKDGRR